MIDDLDGDAADLILASITYHFTVVQVMTADQCAQHQEQAFCPDCCPGIDYSTLLRGDEVTV